MVIARLLQATALLAALGCPAHACAAGDTLATSGRVQAEIVSSLLVTREQDLVFGTVFAGSMTGHVTVTPDARTIYQGGVQEACLQGSCPTPHPASFLVTGEAGRSYRVEIPGSLQAIGNAVADGGAPAIPLLITGLVVETSSTPGAGGSGRLSEAGQDRFAIGGTLQIPARLPAANYRASVPVIVTYG